MPPQKPELSEQDKPKSRKQLLKLLDEFRAEVDRLNELLYNYEHAQHADPSAPQPIYPGINSSEKSKLLAEAQTRRYFEFMEAVKNSLSDGLYGVDHNGNVHTINTAAKRMLGFKYGNVLGRKAHGLLHGKRPDGSIVPVEECALCDVYISGRSAHSDEDVFLRHDDSALLVGYFSLPVLNRDGVSGAVVAFHDITERKQLEAALRQSEHDAIARANQLEANLMAVADALLVYDHDGRVTHANPAARELFGLDASNMPTELKARFPRYNTRDVNGQPMALDKTPLGRILAGEILTNEAAVDIYMQRPDGATVRVNISGAPVRNSAGELEGAVCIARNVTRRHRREERVRDGLRAVLHLLESLLDGDALPNTSTEPAAQSIGKRLVDLTRSLLDCRMVAVAALHPSAEHREQMRPMAVAGLTSEHEEAWWTQVNGACLEDYFSPASVATLRAGTPVFIDITQQPPLAGGRSVFGLRKLLASPLQVQGALVGIMGVEYADVDRAYTEADLDMLASVSRIGALIITRYADSADSTRTRPQR